MVEKTTVRKSQNWLPTGAKNTRSPKKIVLREEEGVLEIYDWKYFDKFSHKNIRKQVMEALKSTINEIAGVG